MKKKTILSILILLILSNSGHCQSYISQTIQYDGETRQYEVYVPEIYNGTVSVPLVFSFHGGSGTSAEQIGIGDLSSYADTANFIAVYPQALPDPNDGGSTNWIHKDPTTVDDVLFIDALIDALADTYQIDLNRIYACGYSLGGEFTLSLACRLNSRIAAIGAVARTMQTYTYNNCSPVHPTGVMTILGTADGISNYDGVFFGGEQYYVSAAEMHSFWASQNNCNANAVTTLVPDINATDGSTVERNTWSTAEGCAYVEELKVIGGGHDWPGSFGNADINATAELWRFLSQYNLNGLIDCTTTSLNEENGTDFGFNIYPNPVSALLEIELSEIANKEFELFNVYGNIVLRGELKSQKNSIDLSWLPANVYFLKINNKTSKILKIE
mgnify:FL=1